MSNFGDLTHTFNPIHDPAYVGNYKCVSNNGVDYVYRRNGHHHHTPHDINYNISNDIWTTSSSAYPTKFGTSRTDSTVFVPTGSSSSLFFYNGNTYQCEMINPDPHSSGSGGGSGATPSSTGTSSTQKKVFCNFW